MDDEELTQKIKDEILNPNFMYDIKYNIRAKSVCKFSADVAETLSFLTTALSIIFAFAAGFFDNMILSFVSGCFGTFGIVLLKLSNYFSKESKERTLQVNKLLEYKKMKPIPNIIIEDNI